MDLVNDFRPKKIEDLDAKRFAQLGIDLKHLEETKKGVYFFLGPSSCGKTTTARVVANYISSNIKEINCGSNNSVEFVRDLIEDASVSDVLGGTKVYILDEVSRFGEIAWTCLLKMIEECPDNCVFFFCTTFENKIPETISSRCKVCRFPSWDNESMVKILEEVSFKASPVKPSRETLEEIVNISGKNLRSALNILQGFIGTNKVNSASLLPSKLMKAIETGSRKEFLSVIKEAEQISNFNFFMQNFVNILLENLYDSYNKDEIESIYEKTYKVLNKYGLTGNNVYNNFNCLLCLVAENVL